MILRLILLGCTAYICFSLFKRDAGTLEVGKLNIISYMYYLFMLQLFVGTALVAIGYDQHYTLSKLLYPTTSIRFTILVACFTLITLPLVIHIFYKIIGFQPQKEYTSFLKKEIVEVDNRFLFLLVGAVVCIQMIILVILLYKIGYIPLLKLFFHDPSFDFALERIRNSGIVAFGGNYGYYIKNIIVILGIPLVSYTTIGYAIANKKLKWIILACICFAMSIITKTLDFSKSPLIFHLFVIILIFIYYKGGIKNSLMVIFGGTMAGILVIFYRIQGYEGNFLDIYNGILGRTFFSQFGTLCYHMELFPHIFDYLGGRSLSPTVLRLLDMNAQEHIRSAKIVMDFYGSDKVYEGIAGVMNASFMGEAYANWGIWGILFSIIWVGFFVGIIFLLCVRVKKTPATIAMMATLTQMIGNMSQGGFVDFIYSFSLWITVVGFVVLIYLNEIVEKIRSVFVRGRCT